MSLPIENPCPELPHTPPAHLTVTFPVLDRAPDMAKVLAAAWNQCEACMSRHRAIAAQDSSLGQQALSIWLMYMAVVIHQKGEMPGATAEALVGVALPDPSDVVSAQTLHVLKSIPVDAAVAPDGALAARWDPYDVAEAIEGLAPQHREEVWADTITFLTGALKGAGRASAEEGE